MLVVPNQQVHGQAASLLPLYAVLSFLSSSSLNTTLLQWERAHLRLSLMLLVVLVTHLDKGGGFVMTGCIARLMLCTPG